MTPKMNPFLPFLDADLSKLDFAKLMEGVKFPGVDVDALVAYLSSLKKK